MSRRRRIVAFGLLPALLLVLGVGVAAAREGRPGTAQAATPVPPIAFAPVRPAVQPSPSPKAVKPKPRKTAKPKPRATAEPTPSPTRQAVRQRSVPRPTATATATHRTLTMHDRLMRAVNQIPGYRPGDAEWIIKPGLGSWGLAVMGGATVYISPEVPADKLYDVVAHEWSHVLTVKVYGGDLMSALTAVNSYFGGADLVGAERAADCMARVLGATWTHYTSCTDARWRDGARRLVSRQRL